MLLARLTALFVVLGVVLGCCHAAGMLTLATHELGIGTSRPGPLSLADHAGVHTWFADPVAVGVISKTNWNEVS